VLLIIALVDCVHATFLELLQLFANGLTYFTDVGNLNIFDLTQIVLQYVVTVLFLLREYWHATGEYEKAIHISGPQFSMLQAYNLESGLYMLSALASLLTFTRFMTVMRGYSELAYLLLMLRVIIADMMAFILVMLFFMFVCMSALVILTSEENPDYDTPLDAVFSAYLVPLMAVFERANYDRRISTAGVLVLFTLLANVVMLNMLIAIMSESYNRVRDRMLDRQLLERAMLILEEQAQKIAYDRLAEHVENLVVNCFGMMAPSVKQYRARKQLARKQSDWFPAWLHCIVKRKDGDDGQAFDAQQPSSRGVRRVAKRNADDTQSAGMGPSTQELREVHAKMDVLAEGQQHIEKQLARIVTSLALPGTTGAAEDKHRRKSSIAHNSPKEKIQRQKTFG